LDSRKWQASDTTAATPRLKTSRSALYNLGRNSLPDAASNPGPAPPSQPDPQGTRRWSILAAGLLLLALALVVIYTSRSAFYSPLALVVVAAIGIAALLLQLRLRKDLGGQVSTGTNNTGVNNEAGSEVSNKVRAPLWLNILGLIFAVAAVFTDVFHISANLMLVAALGSVVCFAISGTAILRALRKKKI
jgi:hypothetical protein